MSVQLEGLRARELEELEDFESAHRQSPKFGCRLRQNHRWSQCFTLAHVGKTTSLYPHRSVVRTTERASQISDASNYGRPSLLQQNAVKTKVIALCTFQFVLE